jgi:hypothetical protein
MSEIASTAADPAALVDELHRQFAAARAALAEAGRLMRRLQQTADEAAAQAAAALAGPRVIKVRAKRPVDPNGRSVKRPVGRPKGAGNNSLTIWATPAQVEELKASLAR